MQLLGVIPNPDDKFLGLPYGNKLKNALQKLEDILPGERKHLRITTDIWTIAKYKKDKVNFRPRHIIDDLDNLFRENLACGLNPAKTVLPEQIIIKNNVITLDGLKQGIKQGWAGVDHADTPFDYNSIGTDGTAESESQQDLIAELSGAPYARKQFSVDGQARIVNQTGKLSMTWDDTEIPSPPKTIRESGVHWHLSDLLKCYARVAHADVIIDIGDIYVVQIAELNANGTL